MRRKWFRVTIHGQVNPVAINSLSWSAGVLAVLVERHPGGELDEWSRRLEPEAHKWQCILRAGSRSFAMSGECREMTPAEINEMFRRDQVGKVAA